MEKEFINQPVSLKSTNNVYKVFVRREDFLDKRKTFTYFEKKQFDLKMKNVYHQQGSLYFSIVYDFFRTFLSKFCVMILYVVQFLSVF